ncbi:NADPH-dependent FMN reductase [Phenylobacterium terrae]|uniref:NADPH-dependent FMN reductase n=1 Tax=Phenylobacterium terrae TaxID=2665495 RepID=A0ABW4N6M3_9CAUL
MEVAARTSSPLSVALVMSTVRPDRFCDAPSAWLAAMRPVGMALDTIDLREVGPPLFAERDPPAVARPRSAGAQAWLNQMARYDAYIFVTAEYNHAPPGVLSNALDHVGDELRRKPAAFVGYGGLGAARAIQQLRLVSLELEMAPLRQAVHITREPYLAKRNGERELWDFEHLNAEANRLLEEIAWWGRALKTARASPRES